MVENIMHLLDEHRGIYIPQHFAQEFKTEEFEGINTDDVAILADGPDNELYWEAWDNVLNNATYVENGKKYSLYQDCSLFGIAYDDLTKEEYKNFFGEERDD